MYVQVFISSITGTVGDILRLFLFMGLLFFSLSAISGIICLLAAVIVIPLPKWRDKLLAVFRQTGFKLITAAALFLVAVILLPIPEASPGREGDPPPSENASPVHSSETPSLPEITPPPADSAVPPLSADEQVETGGEEAAPGTSLSQNQERSAASEGEHSELLEQIDISCEIDTALSQAIVTVTNNSEMTFSGSIHLNFFGSGGKLIGWDIMLVQSLSAGNWTYCRVDLDTPYGDHWESSVSNWSFEAGLSTEAGVLNQEVSAELAEKFNSGFGGDGDPEYAADWYKYVTKIEVYDSAEGQYAVVSVSGASQGDAKSIGTAIFADYIYSPSYRVGEISVLTVVNESGDELYKRSL